ncbi:hypothetical protein KAFR_0A06420 [Kazachstania africana CBS 2517]|uniref:MI domain-containing protein n=1 Tax=Kazachstania africana (strain ATCC 22294 / BCRC 22015 / CBS 2517 / CECT 1963 / NBRC 1671 / NRRL Y-8276) TaxID=1071382 RepID=H2ANX7_KAZAF|nr:hypothetical protein KAFR_0A06420 [Kazachstania africana CBS 2517]CCF56077.1 hypothetical protein KAFR_0A06420 [Kazachstania africana CBS 2517]
MSSQNHGINIPGVLLDELKNRDYSNDERFSSTRKRNTKNQLSRKDKRKQKRIDKKQRQRKPSEPNPSPAAASEDKTSGVPKNEINKSKKIHKQAEAKTEEFGLPFSSDDELSSGDFGEFDDDDLDEEEWEQLRELEGDDEPEEMQDVFASDSEEANELAEDVNKRNKKSVPKKKVTFAAEGKEDEEDQEESDGIEMTVEETMAALKAKKMAKITKKSKKRESEDSAIAYPSTPSERASIERDEMDMQYYAKKLNLKGSKKKLRARDEYDAIGGLLEGLDFFENYGASDGEYGEFALDRKKSSTKEDDDELSSDNSDEIDEADSLLESSDGTADSDSDLSDSDQYSVEEEKKIKKKGKSIRCTQYYRRIWLVYSSIAKEKHLETDNGESAIVLEITKKVKSMLNKLSDSNILVIINSISELYDLYPRHYVTESFTRQTLEIVGQNTKLLDGFLMNYAGVAFALYKLKGIQMGASFIQEVVENFLDYFSKEMEDLLNIEEGAVTVISKRCSNIITFLGYTYNFGFISCKLLYDLIREFVASANELTVELLLRIVSVSGQLIRGDDPSALKEILSDLLANVKSIKAPSSRLQFLLNTMTDLKNNRLKPSLLATDYHPLKKVLMGIFKSSALTEPLQVSLDDIRNVDTKGKWWLVGSSWKGNMETAFEENSQTRTKEKRVAESYINIDDDLFDDIPDWTQLATEQRMNTDVRRAIFVSIMSAQDYMDAFTKLEKLNLKNKQLLEIPRILLHCLLADGGENGYNPYYGLVASKASEHHSQLSKSFQFLFWDVVKKFEDNADSDLEEDDDFEANEDKRLRNIANEAKFFGFLVSENILQLNSFKHVPLMAGLSPDGILFIEVLLYQLLITMGKKSEKAGSKSPDGKRVYSYNRDLMQKMITTGIQLENRSILLKGFRWFIKNKLQYKNYLPGKENEKAFKRDSRRIAWAISEFTSLIDDELNDTNY